MNYFYLGASQDRFFQENVSNIVLDTFSWKFRSGHPEPNFLSSKLTTACIYLKPYHIAI